MGAFLFYLYTQHVFFYVARHRNWQL